jgi:hypothetical protein
MPKPAAKPVERLLRVVLRAIPVERLRGAVVERLRVRLLFAMIIIFL